MARIHAKGVWNETWRLVPPPSGLPEMGKDPGKYFPVISGLWQYHVKTENGIMTSYKSQFCANGSRIQDDPDDMYSPVA